MNSAQSWPRDELCRLVEYREDYRAWTAECQFGEAHGVARRLCDEPSLESMLRKTRDLDFGARADPASMTAVLNGLALERGPGAHVLGPRSLRLGPVSVAFTLGPEDLSGIGELYDEFIESGTSVPLRHGATLTEVPTIGLPELLATKLTRRGDKAKDLLDVATLLSAARAARRAVDLGAVRRLVGENAEASSLIDVLAEELGPMEDEEWT